MVGDSLLLFVDLVPWLLFLHLEPELLGLHLVQLADSLVFLLLLIKPNPLVFLHLLSHGLHFIGDGAVLLSLPR